MVYLRSTAVLALLCVTATAIGVNRPHNEGHQNNYGHHGHPGHHGHDNPTSVAEDDANIDEIVTAVQYFHELNNPNFPVNNEEEVNLPEHEDINEIKSEEQSSNGQHGLYNPSVPTTGVDKKIYRPFLYRPYPHYPYYHRPQQQGEDDHVESYSEVSNEDDDHEEAQPYEVETVEMSKHRKIVPENSE